MMQKLNHPNLVNLIEYSDSMPYFKKMASNSLELSLFFSLLKEANYLSTLHKQEDLEKKSLDIISDSLSSL